MGCSGLCFGTLESPPCTALMAGRDEPCLDISQCQGVSIAAEMSGMHDGTSPLLTDLYQLNMIQAYLDHGEMKTAVFEFFVRKFPARRGFLGAGGLGRGRRL